MNGTGRCSTAVDCDTRAGMEVDRPTMQPPPIPHNPIASDVFLERKLRIPDTIPAVAISSMANINGSTLFTTFTILDFEEYKICDAKRESNRCREFVFHNGSSPDRRFYL